MLQSCSPAQQALDEQYGFPWEDALAVAVPATHLRVMSLRGALVLPTDEGNGSNGGGPKYLNSTGGRAFAQEDIRALVIAPNQVFDLEVQLFDGLGQPVVTGGCGAVR
jgi:hypothetical protein